ncbi:two-component sensor histidine kinase [Halomicronema hongdechloris C2206]|uniref:histidine kinase n=1 Tax=Halomicronema hongdechloris C2206 TaxID=1641165 RepID=A0A1Z3HP09_9CYAN|nr:HAMP domain-containing sensor histidine kinase [Halomicronema hongdechloris]ASC72043.1 two-component sensor histidine kinase [Halomicronema hongdechloris C2206]
MFAGLRWRLLLYQLSVMATILVVFGLGAYTFFSHSLYRQTKQKLRTLAQAATPSMTKVASGGDGYLNQLDMVPWRDIFNRDQQSLEWFNVNGELLARRGKIELSVPPQVGPQTIQGSTPVYTFTVSVFEGAPDAGSPTLRGYIRASQTAQSIQTAKQQLLLGLGVGGGVALVLVGVGGVWLTRISLHPIEQSYHRLMQFTADASHELRGPLTAIKTSVEVMQRHPERIHPRDIKKLSAIASATTQLSTMAADLLLLARMDADTIGQSPQTVLLNPLLRNLVELYVDNARAQGIELTFTESAIVAVIGQPAQFNRLFTNLIQNALQYTYQGWVQVRLSCSRRHALVAVVDTGIGIAPQDLPQVFERFWRADKARSQPAGGSGLGLAITKAITEQYGGKIWVTSTIGSGSCFHVQFPLANATAVKPRSSQPLGQPKDINYQDNSVGDRQEMR